MRRLALLLSLLSLPASVMTTGCATGPGDAALADPVVVYLVRHAERAEDGTNDPSISEAGQARAQELATLLADAGVDHVHSTDLNRTRQTGAPLVEVTGLPVEVYDPSDLPAFAAALEATPGRHLVLGANDLIDDTPVFDIKPGHEPRAVIPHQRDVDPSRAAANIQNRFAPQIVAFDDARHFLCPAGGQEPVAPDGFKQGDQMRGVMVAHLSDSRL